MKRSRTLSDTKGSRSGGETSQGESLGDRSGESSAILRNIASFLTLSDAASLLSQPPNEDDSSIDSWAVGEGYDPTSHGSLWDMKTPKTPGLVALSPGATPRLDYDFKKDAFENDDSQEDTEYMEKILQQKRRGWAQQKLASAIFSHPGSLRSFCVEAYQTAKEIRHRQEQVSRVDPELDVEPVKQRVSPRRSRRRIIIHAIVDLILHNLPLSILIDVVEAVGEVSLDTTFASYRLTANGLNAIVKGLIITVRKIWEFVVNFNPFQLLETIVSFQFNAMEKTSEVLATGIQSVATGMGSASSMALRRLSGTNLSVNLSASKTMPSASLLGDSGLRRPSRSAGISLNEKLLRKLSSVNDAARVVSYMESEDYTGGLSKQARTKVQRMMHYDVSLRPFVATVQVPVSGTEIRFGLARENNPLQQDASSSSFSSNSADSPNGSPFMCTPQSFPPTPHSRSMVMARGGRFADDVVYMARDCLRLHDGLESENEKTREMSKLLREGKRLAVFSAEGISSGVELSCGQHIATKVGNILYAGARSMVPVLRNCFVYFEITVLPRSLGPVPIRQTMMATLSVGLSTEEMPKNTLVGAWQGSCGLCTTGQILVAGQWCTPMNPSLAAFTDGATVGCLVCLDDESAVDTWEGLLVTATVTFNVNGVPCAPMIPPTTRMPVARQMNPSKKNNSSPPDSPDGTLAVVANITDQKALLKGVAVPTPNLPLLVPAAEELYPTVTLHSPSTAVLCRFSAGDICAENRAAIGAPPGATVYAVDGSVIQL